MSEILESDCTDCHGEYPLDWPHRNTLRYDFGRERPLQNLRPGKVWPQLVKVSFRRWNPGPAIMNGDFRKQSGSTESTIAGDDELLHLFVDSVKDYAIFQLGPAGLVRTWNSGAERIKGYTADQITGQHYSCFYTDEDKADGKPERLLQLAAREGRAEDQGWRVRKDGTRFWADVVITALRDDSNNLLGFAKITRDATERKQHEDALRNSEKYARMLFELSPDAILVCGSDGIITEANARVDALFGYSRNELIGRSVETLVPDQFRPAHPKHREEFSKNPHLRPMGIGLELYGKRKDGSEFPVDILLGPVDSANGKIVFVVVRDLSERKRFEEALKRAEEEKRYLQEELTTTHHFDEIVGEAAGLKRVLKQVETVAATDATVLILGETGTGKELVARAIHQLSPRRNSAFVKLNCSAIPAGLLESELFGHEKGAFTGAIAQKIGRLELAHLGTLFLDEIGDLPLELQPKILRALQEKEFERVGGARTIPVNVRLVAATNRDLATMVENREFRSDLYYRLKVFPITIPPLRDRTGDIPVLVKYFVDLHSRRMNRRIETIPPEVMRALTRWHWPGNVRELENLIERSVILSPGPELRVPLSELASKSVPDTGRDEHLHTAERDHILRVLRETKGLISGPTGAAKRLGLKRTTLNSKLKKLGIKRTDYM